MVARGAQQGRVVVTLDGNPPVRPAMPQFNVRADATYLVTGGFGAVGLAITDWLVAQGARHLIVVSRSGARAANAPNAGCVHGARPEPRSETKPSMSATRAPSPT